MTETTYPQLRITPSRYLNPETTELLLNKIYENAGIRRLILNGPNLPVTVPYGPARGTPNENSYRRNITVCGEEFELHVHVGDILIELEDAASIGGIKKTCDQVFADKFPYRLVEGRFMRSNFTLTDYAKFGKVDDERILGMSDPKSKQRPVILQGTK